MKRNKPLLIVTFSIAIFTISIVVGYLLIDNQLNSKEQVNKGKLPNNEVKDDIEILKEEDRITTNTFIEKRIHYKECDHTVTSLNIADNEIINMDKKEYEDYLKSNYPNLQLTSYSDNKIVLFGERNHLCKDHFIIGEEDSCLSIFKIDDDGERVLYKTFDDYPLSLFTQIDQENLREGIVVDSEDELSDVLENFIS